MRAVLVTVKRVRKTARVLVNVAAGVGPALIRSTTDRHADSSGSGCLSDATETKNPSCRHQTRQDTHPSTPVFTVNSSPNVRNSCCWYRCPPVLALLSLSRTNRCAPSFLSFYLTVNPLFGMSRLQNGHGDARRRAHLSPFPKMDWWGILLGVSVVLAVTPNSSFLVTAAREQECDAINTNANATLPVSLRIGLEWFTNPDHLPLIVAQQHGIFRDYGLDVHLIEPKDHWEAEEEILQGRLDVAVTEPLHLAQDAARGKPVLGFARFFHSDGGVMYRTDGEIRRPRDMCGKIIGYPGAPGPGGPAIVNTMVQADGKYDCDLESYGKYNGGFFHTDALESKKADVAALIFWNFEIPEATARGVPVDFFSLKEWGVPDVCQLVLFTTPEKFLALQPQLRKLVLALRKATGIIHQRPELAKSYYQQYTQGKDGDTSEQEIDEVQRQIMDETLRATLPAFPNDSNMASDYYERLMAWLVDTNQVEADAAVTTNVRSYWTNEVAW